MDFVTSFIALLYLTAILSTSFGDECTNVDLCSCQASKYKINLNPLNTGSNPRNCKEPMSENEQFTFSTPGGEYTYYYQPCIALSGKCAARVGGNPAGVCQASKTGGGEFDAGDANSAKFSGDADAGSLKLTYTADPRGPDVAGVPPMSISWIFGHEPSICKISAPELVHRVRTSVISLQCSCAEGDFSFVEESPTNTYNFVLKTIHACGSVAPNCGPPDNTQHGLSTGSVLLILFFVFLTVYFVAGILFLKFARGAQGKEMVPNYEFWTAIPGLVKDGVQFTFRGCKTDSSYSQI